MAGAEDMIMLGYNNPLVRNIDGKDYEIAPGKYYTITKNKDIEGYPSELIEVFNASKELVQTSASDAASAFTASKNPDIARKIGKVAALVEKMQRNIAEYHKANIKEIAEKAFDKFAKEAREEFRNQYAILKNPANIISEAYDRANGWSYSEPLALIETAIGKDANFSAAAFYNKAYFLLKQQASDYKKNAHASLHYCVANIRDILIPQLEIIYLCEDAKSDSDLSKQIRGKIKALNEIKSSAENLIKQIVESQAKELDVSRTKYLKEAVKVDELSDDDIAEFTHFGFRQIFELESRLPESSFWGSILTAFVGTVQIIAGACCMLAGNVPGAIALFKGGIGDWMDSYKIATGQIAFDLDEYISSKGKDILCQLAINAALSVAASGKSLLDGAKAWGESFMKSTKEAWGAGLQAIGVQTAQTVAATSTALVQTAATSGVGTLTMVSSGNEAMIAAASMASGTTATLAAGVAKETVNIVKDFTKELVKEFVGYGLKEAISSGVEAHQQTLAKEAVENLKLDLDKFFGKVAYQDKIVGILLADRLYIHSQIHKTILDKTLDVARKEKHFIGSAVSNILQFVAAGCKYEDNTVKIIRAVAMAGSIVAVPIQALKQIEHFVDDVGQGCMRFCSTLPEYSLRSMIEHKIKAQGVIQEELDEIMSILGVKGYLTDAAEINLPRLKASFAESNAKGENWWPKILEGRVGKYNTEIVLLLENLHSNYEEAVEAAYRGFDALKAEIAGYGQEIIYEKVRGEIVSPLTNTAVAKASEFITNGMQETLAKYSNGGALTDALVDAEERMKVRDAEERAAGNNEVRLQDLGKVLEGRDFETSIQELVQAAIQDGIDAAGPEGVGSGSEAVLDQSSIAAIQQKIEDKVAKKFGEKVGKMVAIKIAARIPLYAAGATNPIAFAASMALTAKDVYDIAKAVKESYDAGEVQQETINEAIERGKAKDEERKQERSRVGAGVSGAGGQIDPENGGDSDDEVDFNPGAEGHHDRVDRTAGGRKFYRDAKDSKTWWSKDDAGHGGEHWKQFKEIGGELFRKAEVDTNGKVMTKNLQAKHPKGIKLKDLIRVK